MYWAQALVKQTRDEALQAKFISIAASLAENESKIIAELIAAQGEPVDIGGYFHTDDALTDQAMRPSATLNSIIDSIN